MLFRPRTLLITDHMLLQPTSKFALMPTFVARFRSAEGLASDQKWIAFGAQPVWYYHPHFSLAFDTGFDWVSNPDPGTCRIPGGCASSPSLNRSARSRSSSRAPCCEFSSTDGNWSEAFVGRVGGAPFINAKAGLTAGIQAETWW